MAALTTLEDLKIGLEIPSSDTSRDAVLTQLITQITALIEQYTDKVFGPDSYTEYYSGDNTPTISLRQTPVTGITSVHVDSGGYWGQGADGFDTDTLLTAGVDYALQIDSPDGSSRTGLLQRLNGSWSGPVFTSRPGNLAAGVPVPLGNIRVVYDAGLGSIPPDVALAAQLAVARIWRSAKYGGLLQSENTPKYSYSLATAQIRADGIASLPPEALSILAGYRRLAIG